MLNFRTPPGSDEPRPRRFRQHVADAEFLDALVPRLRGVAAFAESVGRRVERPRLRRFAARSAANHRTVALLAEGVRRELVTTSGADEVGVDHARLSTGAAAGAPAGESLDRGFIDESIRRGEGLFVLARAELAHGSSRRVRALALDVAGSAARDIRTLNGWRLQWFGERLGNATLS